MSETSEFDKYYSLGRPVLRGDQIGTGSFSVVYRATHRLSGESVAVKVLPKLNEDDFFDTEAVNEQAAIEKELSVLSQTSHIHGVIEFYEVSSNQQRFDNEKEVLLVFELFQGEELFSVVKRKKR